MTQDPKQLSGRYFRSSGLHSAMSIAPATFYKNSAEEYTLHACHEDGHIVDNPWRKRDCTTRKDIELTVQARWVYGR